MTMDLLPEPAWEAAAWYVAQARMHEALATQPGPVGARESALASWAYERSRILLRPNA